MRALNTLFELFGAARVPAGHSDLKARYGSKFQGVERAAGSRENAKIGKTKPGST